MPAPCWPAPPAGRSARGAAPRAAACAARPPRRGRARRRAGPALQRADGTFPDSIRPGTHGWGRYGEAGLGYALILAGVRSGHPEWTRGGRPRAGATRARRPDRLVGVREHADRVGLQPAAHARAGDARVRVAARASGRTTCARSGRLFNARHRRAQLSSNKYLVEAVARPRARAQRAALDASRAAILRDAAARRAGARSTCSTGSCRGASRELLRRSAAGQRVTALSDRSAQPLAYHALATALLGAGDRRSRAARVARARGARCGSARARSGPTRRRTATSPGPAAAGPVVGAGGGGVRGRRAGGPSRAGRARARAGRSRSARWGGSPRCYPIRADGMAIVPSAAGPATVAAIDDYASQVVYNGLTLTALGWAAGERPRALPAARPAARRPRARRRGAAVRAWRASRRCAAAASGSRSSSARSGATRARRSACARSSGGCDGGRWVDLLPAPAAPIGPLGPALLLPLGCARARARGTSVRVRRGRVVVRGGWVHRGRWVRRGVRFRSCRRDAARASSVDARRGDRIVYSALTDGRPVLVRRGVVAPRAATLARVPARTAGPRPVRVGRLARRVALGPRRCARPAGASPSPSARAEAATASSARTRSRRAAPRAGVAARMCMVYSTGRGGVESAGAQAPPRGARLARRPRARGAGRRDRRRHGRAAGKVAVDGRRAPGRQPRRGMGAVLRRRRDRCRAGSSTAAHCVVGERSRDIDVLVGRTRLTDRAAAASACARSAPSRASSAAGRRGSTRRC